MAQSQEYGAYLPTTDDLDINTLLEGKMDPGLKDFLVRLYQSYNNIANVVNVKESAYYLPVEFVNGQQWFALTGSTNESQTRQVYRRVVDFGTLPNTGTTSVAHNIEGISAETTFTRIYGCASDTAAFSYLPIPFASTAATGNISVSVDATNVIITTDSDRTAYTTTYVILEYLKN